MEASILGVGADSSVVDREPLWCPRLHLGEGKGVGSWLAGAKMPTELRKWAWMTGVAGNGEVKSDYRDSYPDQRREGWDV